MLNNLFKVCWMWKNADIICYKLTSLVSLYQKLMKISNTGREIFRNFWTTWEILMKFSGKMCLMVISKVTKNQGFTLSLDLWKIYFSKNHRGESNYPPSPLSPTVSRLMVNNKTQQRNKTLLVCHIFNYSKYILGFYFQKNIKLYNKI